MYGPSDRFSSVGSIFALWINRYTFLHKDSLASVITDSPFWRLLEYCFLNRKIKKGMLALRSCRVHLATPTCQIISCTFNVLNATLSKHLTLKEAGNTRSKPKYLRHNFLMQRASAQGIQSSMKPFA